MEPNVNTSEAMNFANSIPMGDLFEEIKRVTGINDLHMTYKITENRDGKPVINFKSQDLSDRIGFLNLIFKEIVVSNFNSSIVYRNNNYIYWCTIEFRYTHPGGGQNGQCFYCARYSNNTWEFGDHLY